MIQPPEKRPTSDYAEALQTYLTGSGETGSGENALVVAYTMGRDAITESLGSLVALHGEALKQAAPRDLRPEQLTWLLDRATQFLEEAVAPFEMTIRGFQEANRELQRANQELSRVSQVKSEFLANMSHELRTPLNSILGFTELLLSRPDAYDDEARTRFLTTVNSSGHHLLDLINDLLDLSKIEAGRMELSREAFAADELVNSVVAEMGALAESRGLRMEVALDRPAVVVADRRRLRQVVINLLGNAIKFTPEAGLVRVIAQRTSDELLIGVSDTGPGIAEEDQERIFGEFEQASSSSPRSIEGTGLGLALTKRLVELHGGRVWLHSEVGVGSTFWVSIPATERGLNREWVL